MAQEEPSSLVPVAATTVVHTPQVQSSIFEMTPRKKVAFAAEVASVLTDVIEKQNLFTVIQGKKYIRAEGWATLGTMLNVLPKEQKVVELPDGSYEAWVDLISTQSGHVVGGASALCGVDEKRWAGAERYARRSMAVTRATGKAYRLAFAFIPAMAGYATTPAEEMPNDVIQANEIYEGTDAQKKALAKAAKEFNITKKEDLIKLSDGVKGTPMANIRESVESYVLNH